MAGSIIVSSITLDSDNNFSIKSNTGATLFFANTTGIDIANSIGATAITNDKILSVANTKITGNIISSQITSVANTQLTGTITGSQISSNTLSNTVFQTGSVENYMNSQNLGFGMRNRIINGAMVIDQRNGGASVNPTDGQGTVDQWRAARSQASKITVQQNAGAVTPPVGFSNYLGVTSSSAYTVLAADYFFLFTKIEGFNFADMAWGTANAQTITLSFWVRSSLTGTFGGSVLNSAQNRSYPFTYTINAANTWEKETITIAGDASGTWIGATNGVGLQLYFGLGVGSTGSGTAGAWAAAGYQSATGATSVVGTNGATFYITGVQLEKGSTATSFDYRPFGTELALCQRYCCVIPINSNGVGQGIIGPWGANYNATNGRVWYNMPVTMRATPSVSLSGNQYSIIGVNDTATGTNANFHYSNQVISFDGTSLSTSSATGQPLSYRGGGLITAEL